MQIAMRAHKNENLKFLTVKIKMVDFILIAIDNVLERDNEIRYLVKLIKDNRQFRLKHVKSHADLQTQIEDPDKTSQCIICGHGQQNYVGMLLNYEDLYPLIMCYSSVIIIS